MTMALPQNEIVFKGHVGKFGQKEGYGEEMYKGRQGYESYIGNFKRDAYNGYANYFANSIKRGLWAFDGNFCANRLEGYGAMSYGDATFFAGLFKNDKPFGPGVLTYPNGRQDVGIWCGSQLYRLSTTVGQIEKLTNSPQDRIQVTKFKKLIAINEAPRDIASAIIRSFGSTDDVQIDPSHLYSRFCKDPKSYFYDHKYFNDDLDDLVEIEKSLKEEVSEVQKSDTNTLATKFVNTSIVELKEMKSEDEVDNNDFYRSNSPTNRKFKEEVYILSWNNTPNVINIMKHSFKHRKQEETSDFDIGDILCGRRKLFRMRGPKETASIKVLEASSCNDVLTILKQLKRHALNVDVMDNKGNSMLLRAAANDALEVMQMLHLLGADIDTVNDEGFSALTHTLTRYIALKYDVHNWSLGFLQRRQRNEEAEDLEEQWLDECMLSNYSINQASMISIVQRTYSKVKKNKKLGSVLMPSKASIHPTKIFSPETSTEYVFELSPEPRIPKMLRDSRNIPDNEKSEKKKRLEIIKNTAFYLLDIGADIHVSVTPTPVMILAIFSGCLPIVEKLLKCGADANELYNINNGQLTALHIIAQARPLPSYPAMVNMFLRYGADPNLRTSVNYNMTEWEYLLEFAKLSHSIVPGLTPLHIIALRSDATYVTNKEYLEQICCLLSWFSNHNELFFGLSPLGLAISKGNSNIVSTMLNCAKIDVNATFDTFWGNPLFTYLRCHAFKDDPTTLDILRTLILKGADPLETSNIVRGKGNALNFIAQMKDRRMRTHSKWTIYGFPQVSNDFNLRNHEQILMELAKLNLRKHIRGVLIRLHLKFIDRMDSEKESYLRQIHLFSKRRQPSITSESVTSIDEDRSDYGYYEICERTKDWMNSIEECRDIMEKTIESMGDFYSPVKAIRFMALLPNLTIVPKKSELKHLKITRLLDGKCLPDLRTCPIEKNKEFSFQSLIESDFEENEEENMKWIRHFVKVHTTNAFVYPEMEKKRTKYIVCYKCLKQSAFTQACPICRLVYFCSMKCNLADSQRPDPYHRCGLVFWNLQKDQFFTFEKMSSYAKKTKKSILKKVGLRKKSKVSSKVSSPTPKHDIEQEEHWSSHIEITSESSSDDYEYRRKIQRKYSKDRKSFKHMKDMKKLKKKFDVSKVRFKKGKGKGKGKKGKKIKLASSFRLFRRRPVGFASLSDEATEVDVFGLGERDRKWDRRSTRPSIHVAARLLERQSYILEQKRLETQRLKEAQDAIDTKLLGEVAPPEEFWEKSAEYGEGKKHHTSHNRFMAFLKMLEAKFGSFDLDKYLPFILFVDGVMYYKFYDDKFKENYSFN